jgi:two-component system response regulator YesN
MYHAVIVDDDIWALHDIRRSFNFTEFGFGSITECDCAEDAFKKIATSHPDLVITDIKMERLSGLDLIRKCREKDIHSLFIILSGYDKFDYAKEAIRQGAFHYMLKPIDDQESLEVMNRVSHELSKMKKNKRYTTWEIDNNEDCFKRIVDFLELNSDSFISLDLLSETFFVNRTYVCDMFRKHLNKTFTQYLAEIRIRNACELLESSNLDIADIASKIGFDDANYFSRIFKKVKDITPIQYRRKFQK